MKMNYLQNLGCNFFLFIFYFFDAREMWFWPAEVLSLQTEKVGSLALSCTFLYFIFPGEEVRAEFFMEELNNGVKLCQLIGVLQTKIAQSCPSALCKVSHTAPMKTAWMIVQRAAFMLPHGGCLGRAVPVTVWTNIWSRTGFLLTVRSSQLQFCHYLQHFFIV